MNTIEETIKFAGWGRRKVMRKQIEAFENQLIDGEEMIGAIASYPRPTEQLYITNMRVIVHKIEGVLSNTRVEIPLSTISSINVNSKLLSTRIDIVASNNVATIDNTPVHIAQEIKKILDTLILKQAK